jgi:hypothetical protein
MAFCLRSSSIDYQLASPGTCTAKIVQPFQLGPEQGSRLLGPRGPNARPATGAGALILNTLFQRISCLRKSDAAVLAWFWLSPWQSPCLVPFQGKGDDNNRADEPELHAGVAAFSGPILLTDV